MRDRKAAFWTLLAGIVGLAGACGGGGGGQAPCSTAPQDNSSDAALVAAWDAVRQQGMAELQVAEGWGNPELLQGSVNTIGWEDSAFIAPDGSTLYFAYVNVDLVAWVLLGGANQAAILQYLRGPTRGVPQPPYVLSGYGSGRERNAFCVPAPFPFAQTGVYQWGMHRSDDGSWYYVQSTADLSSRAIYENGAPLWAPITVEGDEDDPHLALTSYGRELFFWSDLRAGGPGGGDLWVSIKTGNLWGMPVPLAAPINSDSKESQPHFRPDGRLFFTSSRDGIDSIYVSTRQGANSWSAPGKVLWANPGGAVAGIGEPTLTADGQWLTFVVAFVRLVNGIPEFNADIGRVQRTAS